MAMESRVLQITPNMAKVMLEKNMKNNRRLNHNTVKRYARIMKSGGWNLTHAMRMCDLFIRQQSDADEAV